MGMFLKNLIIYRLARVLLSADIRTSVDKMLKDLDWVRLTHRWDHHLLIQTF